MSDYTELVKALRLCQFGKCGCGKCYYKELKGDWCTEDNHPEFFDCDDKLKLDAAAAIEDLQAELAGSKDAIRILKHNLEMKKPKMGEWIHNTSVYGTTTGGLTVEHHYTCSVCGGLMGRKGDAYCYNCGAKMTEVQDGKN